MESPLCFRDVVCMVGHIARMLGTAVNVAVSVIRVGWRFHVAVHLSVSHAHCAWVSCAHMMLVRSGCVLFALLCALGIRVTGSRRVAVFESFRDHVDEVWIDVQMLGEDR